MSDVVMVGDCGPYKQSPDPTPANALFRCGHDVARERIEMGYAHCSRPSCVASWRRSRLDAAGLALVLAPKQGMAWVYKSETSVNTSSSGRS